MPDSPWMLRSGFVCRGGALVFSNKSFHSAEKLPPWANPARMGHPEAHGHQRKGTFGKTGAALGYPVSSPPIMKYLSALIRGVHSAIGISLPTPQQEKAVALVWLGAAVMLVLIVLGTGWLVLSSMSSSVTYR